MKIMQHMKRDHGFTLIELLVVILIIGLLTAVVAPRFLGQVSKSEVTTARAQMDAIDKALQAYRIDMGQYPTTEQSLAALLVAPGGLARWRGPYMSDAIPPDPWGQVYQYRSPGRDGREYELMSFGRDRAPGGTGDDSDIRR